MALKRVRPLQETQRLRAQRSHRWQAYRREPIRPQYGGVTISSNERALVGPLSTVVLSRTEWLVLDKLARNGGSVVTRETLLETVWGSAYMDAPSLLHDAISHLRSRFLSAGGSRSPILNLHGVGYRLIPD